MLQIKRRGKQREIDVGHLPDTIEEKVMGHFNPDTGCYKK
jgi:hypothetical protein